MVKTKDNHISDEEEIVEDVPESDQEEEEEEYEIEAILDAKQDAFDGVCWFFASRRAI